MKMILSIFLSVAAWLIVMVISNTSELKGMSEFKENSKAIHGDIRDSLKEIRSGQLEIMKVLIDNN